MSFQSDHKISNADRADKGVYGLPDTPGMSTTEIQERFDSLANLAIDKYNGLVDAVEEEVTNESKLVTGAAVKAYTDNKVASAINDVTPSNDTTYSSNKIDDKIAAKIDDSASSADKTYSSQKIDNLISEVPTDVIKDSTSGANTTYSSQKIDQLIAGVPAQSVIDDSVTAANRTYSSQKIEEKLQNVPITPIDDSSVSQSSVYSSSMVVNLINSIPIPDPGCQIDDENETNYTTYSSAKIVELINGTQRPITGSIASTLSTTVDIE